MYDVLRKYYTNKSVNEFDSKQSAEPVCKSTHGWEFVFIIYL
jgi:hypothetical protein